MRARSNRCVGLRFSVRRLAWQRNPANDKTRRFGMKTGRTRARTSQGPARTRSGPAKSVGPVVVQDRVGRDSSAQDRRNSHSSAQDRPGSERYAVADQLRELLSAADTPAAAKVNAARTLAEIEGMIGRHQLAPIAGTTAPLSSLSRDQLQDELSRLRTLFDLGLVT
jgi:hypothetical protein